METAILPALTANGKPLELTADAFGSLRSSNDLLDDGARLRDRVREDGYLLLRGVLDPDAIMNARRYITDRLAEEGQLDPEYPSIDAVARPGADLTFRPDLALHNVALLDLLYTGPMMALFERFLGEEVLHFDFTWLRATAPGRSANPHCDIVFMGRGTFDVFTCWTPLGDIAIDGGALMILEDSHTKAANISDYLARDVDSYCTNGPNAAAIEQGAMEREWSGELDNDAPALRRRLGGRWLSSEFHPGDVLIFTMGTVHASLDNLSDRIRLSSDSRYQRASEPADERWMGTNPIGHSRAGLRGRIC